MGICPQDSFLLLLRNSVCLFFVVFCALLMTFKMVATALTVTTEQMCGFLPSVLLWMSAYTTVSFLFAVAWLVSQHRRFSLVGHSERQRGRQAILSGVTHLWRRRERCHVTALAQTRGDTTSPVSRLQNVGQQRSVLCCIYRVISILILYYLRCWNQLYPRFRSYHTALHLDYDLPYPCPWFTPALGEKVWYEVIGYAIFPSLLWFPGRQLGIFTIVYKCAFVGWL